MKTSGLVNAYDEVTIFNYKMKRVASGEAERQRARRGLLESIGEVPQYGMEGGGETLDVLRWRLDGV